MPELPEVETIANGLRLGGYGQPPLLGRRIERVHLLWKRTLASPTQEEFERRATGQVFQSISRRGKFLVMELSPDYLLFHLRMSGDLLIEPITASPSSYHRLVLDLDEGWRLSFNDTRKFGRAWLVADPEIITGSLGPEPLDHALTPGDFHQMLSRHHRRLKPLLLDQAFLAGLGNIYTDEALFLARLHPHTLAHTLTPEQATGLLESIRRVLREGIHHHGASIDWAYRGGEFQNHFRVYQRTGEACPNCGTPIQRIVVGQRGTHFCPSCQPIQSGEA